MTDGELEIPDVVEFLQQLEQGYLLLSDIQTLTPPIEQSVSSLIRMQDWVSETELSLLHRTEGYSDQLSPRTPLMALTSEGR